MASIDPYLQDIVDAKYGEEVRWSIHDALSAMNTESSTAITDSAEAKRVAITSQTSAANKAAEAAASAQAAAESAQEASQYAQGGLVYKGSISFSQIPVSGMKAGDEYNMNEDFTTDNRFVDGAGIFVNAGTNIAWQGTLWDVLATGGSGIITASQYQYIQQVFARRS